MPIRPALRSLYPADWPALSRRVRFERAGGRCQGCGRPHLADIRCLPDGRWFDGAALIWRDQRGRSARWPEMTEVVQARSTRVVLAAAHLDNNPANNRLANLRCLCQRCHMRHDRPYHRVQRWLTYRQRWAIGDLFLGLYGVGALSHVPVVEAFQARGCRMEASVMTPEPDRRRCMPDQTGPGLFGPCPTAKKRETKSGHGFPREPVTPAKDLRVALV